LTQTEQRQSNDRVGLGGHLQVHQRFSINAEVSDGELGSGALVGGEYQYSDRGSLYLAHSLQAENPDAINTGRLGRSTLGVRNRFSDRVSVFAETRLETSNESQGTTQYLGVDITPWDNWLYAFTYETGTLTDALTGDTQRNAGSATIAFSDTNVRLSTTLELRQDDNPTTGKLDIYALRALASWQVTPGWRLYSKANVADTQSDVDPTFDAQFAEYVVASAYRPVAHNRFNFLFKYTYLEDLPSPAQVSGLSSPVEFAQRSQVFAIDGSWQLATGMSLGAKYAYRLGELRLSRDTQSPWFDSKSNFVAARVDLTLWGSWELLLEGRHLRVVEADDARSGWLTVLSRRLGQHLKVGLGYNFTDFSDDLTDLSFDSRGAFINMTGVF